MLRQIGQWLVKVWQRFRGIFRKRQEAPPSLALTDAERERLFLQLLNIVDKFGQVEVLRCVETLKQRSAEAEWVTWLQKFGERLLESPAPNRQLGQRMVKLGEVGCGELGEIARAIATQLLARESQPGGEAPTTEINAEAEALFYRGVDLYNQNDRIGALDCWERAIAFDSNFHYAWNNKGAVLRDLGRYQEALDCVERAIAIKSNDHYAWNNKGAVLSDLERYQEALDCFDRASAIKSDFHEAWCGKGLVLRDLGRYQEALDCFDRALELQRDYHEAWNGKGNVLRNLGRYEEAIIALDYVLQLTNHQHWEAWANRGWAVFYSLLRGYEAAIQNWDEGLRAIQSTADPEAHASLHQTKGDAHYRHGRLQPNPYTFWREGKLSYLEALKCLVIPSDASPKTGFLDSHNAFGTLRAPQLRQLYLENLKRLAKVCSALRRSAEAEECLSVGEVMLEQLLREIPLKDRFKLTNKFATFHQLRVDLLAQSPEPAKQIEALELAEARKNLCLRLLRQGRSDALPDSPNYPEIQRQLLNPHTAAIYWHLSDTSLTTFILCDNAAPGISMLRDTDPTASVKLHEFESWMKRWKSHYQLYRKDAKEATADNKETWRDEMLDELKKLAKYLKIEEILESLQTLPQTVTELILIPHRDLHLLPLEYLFRDSAFTLTRLPSAQTGIELQKLHTPTERHLLNVECPSPLLFAEMESAAIAHLYRDNLTPIFSNNATKQKVIESLKITAGIFHFTGHGNHDFENPLESALELSDRQLLTLRDIFELNLSRYLLICLCACETGITSYASALDEYVGLVSGFLAAKVRYVVSTLWQVQEISAALMMIRFHQLLVENPDDSPAAALRKTQQWLRTVTSSQLAQWYRQLAEEIGPKNRGCRDTLLAKADSSQKQSATMGDNYAPYAHPYHWAGFAITGKVNL